MSFRDSFFEWFRNILNLTSRKKKLALIRSKWAQDVVVWRDPDLVEIYHQFRKTESQDYVDDKTWLDLKMWNVFEKLDRTVSTSGRQVLFHKLKSYQNDNKKINSFFSLIQIFKANKELREKIQLQLMSLETTQSYFLPVILNDKEDRKISFPFLYHFLGYLSYILPVLIFVKPVFIFLLIIVALLNISINIYFTKKVYKNFSSYYYLAVMANITLNLSKQRISADHSLFDNIKSSKNLCRKIRRRMGNILTDRSTLSDLEQAGIEYMNMIGLYDLRVFLKTNELLKNYKKELNTLFDTFGEIDAAISIASYLEQNPDYCRPKFNNYNNIDISEIVHPLIVKPVSNSISLSNKSLLITGSNMAGKTTFIRTIGVNFILAQTIGIVLASKADIPRLQVFSSIRIEDNQDEGKSYYQVEVDELLKFLEKKNEVNKFLFLIDEIFRGTNTIERISASTSVLKYLGKSNLTFVTTHDIELQNLLGKRYEMKHFSECVDGEKLYFDYKIKDGPCTSRNAIKLLEISGYPDEVVSAAYKFTENFKH